LEGPPRIILSGEIEGSLTKEIEKGKFRRVILEREKRPRANDQREEKEPVQEKFKHTNEVAKEECFLALGGGGWEGAPLVKEADQLLHMDLMKMEGKSARRGEGLPVI